MIPRDDQVSLAVKGYHILKEHMIVYLAAEERVGKSLPAVLIAEMCSGVERVLIITKKKPIAGWFDTLSRYNSFKEFDVTTYHSAHKCKAENYQLIILDEAHNYISSYPKTAKIWAQVKALTLNKPLIYISATPHPQGYQQLYHQFKLSSWSPFKKYSDFYSWFKTFGIPEEVYIDGIARQQYHKTHEKLIKPFVDHLFVTATRKESNFKFEPKDKVHYIELSDYAKNIYNRLIKDLVYDHDGTKIICDTRSKLRYALHMLEGGTAKGVRDYLILHNTEKIDYIIENWGDNESLVIFYNYKEEEIKLHRYFKKARILQGTSYAEGVELSQYETIVVYSHDFSTGKFTQRRARQASMHRKTEIVVHYLVVADAVSEQAYETVAINKKNFVDTVFERKTL